MRDGERDKIFACGITLDDSVLCRGGKTVDVLLQIYQPAQSRTLERALGREIWTAGRNCLPTAQRPWSRHFFIYKTEKELDFPMRPEWEHLAIWDSPHLWQEVRSCLFLETLQGRKQLSNSGQVMNRPQIWNPFDTAYSHGLSYTPVFMDISPERLKLEGWREPFSLVQKRMPLPRQRT